MTPPNLSCRDFIEFLMAYQDDELSPEERTVFDAHLAVCPSCVNYLDSYRRTAELERAAFADSAGVPSEVPEQLVRAILSAKRVGE